jgi:hypothetical protein
MHQHLFLLPTLPMALAVAVGCMVLALVGFYLFRRLRLHLILQHNNTFTASIYPIIAGIYGVFLAFTVVIAWSQFMAARHSATHEVTYLSELWRDSQIFPPPIREKIDTQLMAYTKAVIDDEWRVMAELGQPSAVAENAYENLWRCYYELKPRNLQEQVFLQAALRELNGLGRQRRQRLMASRSSLPRPMWIFLICGAALTIFLTYLFETRNQRLQGVVIGLLAGLIGFGLILVFSLQYPFTGDVSIKPQAFQELLTSFKQRQQQQAAGPGISIYHRPKDLEE